MLWFFLFVGIVGIVAYNSQANNVGSGAWTPGDGWTGIEFSSSDDDHWSGSSFDDNDDMYYSPVYSHLPCNIHYDMFGDDDMFSSDDEWSSSSSLFDDDHSSSDENMSSSPNIS